jgi:hypothetical protein
MDPQLKSAAAEAAEAAKVLAEKLDALAKAAAVAAEPFVDEAGAQLRDLAAKAEAAAKKSF